MSIPSDLSHTPGVYYAVAYWLSALFFTVPLIRSNKKLRYVLTHLGFLVLLTFFMGATDGLPTVWFFPCMTVTMALLLFDIKLSTGETFIKSGYFCARAFILGEFAASLQWQLFYFSVTALGLPMRIDTSIMICAVSHSAVFFLVYLLERNYRAEYKGLRPTPRTLVGAVILCLAAYALSNLSYAFQNTPFSSQFTPEIFIIRTLVDLDGVISLFAYHIALRRLDAHIEMQHLQNLLHMQYESYRISEEGIAMVNQKYHDLKHQIALLRSEALTDKKREYLDQMERDIRSYEARNNTGNHVLDIILSTKIVQCQNLGIKLTCVADGAALQFIEPMDISALFGNALDNAIESVKKLCDDESDKKLIHLSVYCQKGFLFIRTENYYSGDIRFIDGMPVTTKLDRRYHGYGLKSIRSIAEKYGGSMTVCTKNNWFELRIMFPLQSQYFNEA